MSIYTDDFMFNTLGITEIPEKLYHCTSIETLALILEQRTLQFSRLDGVNDPEEAMAPDLPNASTLVFASCWTAEKNESLAMWKMYTPDMQGVRVQMPNNPFDGRDKPEAYDIGGFSQILKKPIEISRKNEGMGIVTRQIYGPNKICYSNDPNFRGNPCISQIDGKNIVQLYDLGMFKSTDWEFEQEWRFKILGTFGEGAADKDYIFDLTKYPVIETSLYVPLDMNCTDQIHVTLGPRITAGQALIVKALLDKYTSQATLDYSSLNVR